MDWRTLRDYETGRLPLPSGYMPRLPRIELDREAALESQALLEQLLNPVVYDDRPDWVWWFEFAACEVRVRKARAKELSDTEAIRFYSYAQIGLSLILKRRAELLGVDVDELTDVYVRFHRAVGVWEPELLIVGSERGLG